MRMIFASSASSNSNVSGKPLPKVIVVGGGAGGLACAGRLAKAGCSVTLLEKNDVLGGRVQSEYIDGWRFDTGPSLLLFPDKYAETFEALGTAMPDAIDIRRVDPAAYRVFFPATPSFRVDLLYDRDAMASQLEALEPGAGEAYLNFLTMARNHLDLGVPYFIDRDFTELKDAKGLMDLLPKMSSINPWKLLGPHDLVMRGFFNDPRLRAAFTFQDLYVGLTPGTAPAVFSLLAGTEITDGVWYPIGGFGTVRDAFAAAAGRNGVDVRTSAEVRSFEIGQESGAVEGVTLSNGEFLAADVVVCNRDLPAAYSLLFKNSTRNEPSVAQHAAKKAQNLARLKYSAGIIAFNWCIRGKLPELMHHNVFLSETFEKAWNLAKSPTELPHFPNFYVHVPSRTDSSAAPEDCDSVMVLLPVKNMKTRDGGSDADDYSSLVAAGRERILNAFRFAGVGEVESMIEKEMVITPPQWEERYGLKHGAAFGLAHSLSQLSLFRPSNKDEVFKGLYFVGASTRPGNGVPLCLIGAKLTAERVLKDWVYL